MVNGTYVPEGVPFELKEDEVPKTTDVVFIVEAKECNHNLSTAKNIPVIVAALEKAFGENGLKNSRYVPIDLFSGFFKIKWKNSFFFTIFLPILIDTLLWHLVDRHHLTMLIVLFIIMKYSLTALISGTTLIILKRAQATPVIYPER